METVIVQERVPFSVVEKTLRSYFRVRIGRDKKELADVIMPLRRLFFKICDVRQIPEQRIQEEVERLKSFNSRFSRAIALILVSESSWSRFFMIQEQLLTEAPVMIPCQSIDQGMKEMISIADGSHKQELSETQLQELNQIVQSGEEVLPYILHQSIIGLSIMEAEVLIQGMGSLYNVIQTQDPNLMAECTSLSIDVCERVVYFFQEGGKIDE